MHNYKIYRIKWYHSRDHNEHKTKQVKDKHYKMKLTTQVSCLHIIKLNKISLTNKKNLWKRECSDSFSKNMM